MHLLRNEDIQLFNNTIFYFQINDKKTVVCSRHFLKEDYKWSPGALNGKRLKPGVVPTIFSWIGPEKSSRQNPLVKFHDNFHASDISDSEDENMDTSVPLSEVQTEEQPSTSSTSHDQQPVKLEEQAILIKQLMADKQLLATKIDTLESDNERLKAKLEIERFGVDRFGCDNHLFKFYTGFFSVAAFMCFFILYNHQQKICKKCTIKQSNKITL